jgi:hypothetical protein
MKVTIATRYASVRLYLRAASVDDDMFLAHWTRSRRATRVAPIEGDSRGPLLSLFRREAGGQRFEAIFVEPLKQPRGFLIAHAFGHELAEPLYA